MAAEILPIKTHPAAPENLGNLTDSTNYTDNLYISYTNNNIYIIVSNFAVKSAKWLKNKENRPFQPVAIGKIEKIYRSNGHNPGLTNTTQPAKTRLKHKNKNFFIKLLDN